MQDRSDVPPPTVLQFGEFALDEAAYELRRRGRPVRLERLAMELLLLLVHHRGELVTRSHIVERLWGRDVFLEVDASVNSLIRKIRRALHDSVERPRFVQTVQGKGYRFIAPVEILTKKWKDVLTQRHEPMLTPWPDRCEHPRFSLCIVGQDGGVQGQVSSLY